MCARLMAAGCGKGAASFLSLVPMAKAFLLKDAVFVTAARRYNGLLPVELPHYHHCGNRGLLRLGAMNCNHLYNCSCLGGNIRPHDAVKNTLAHAVHQCGLTSSLPKTEVEVTRDGCEIWHSDIQFFDDSTGRLFVVDVAIVNIDSATALRRRGDFGDVEASLVQVKDEKKDLPIPARLEQAERGSTVFVPFVMSSAGGFGPAARAFLKSLYATARARGRWLMASGQPALELAWNTVFASTYWDMRLSVACTSASAEVVNRLVARDQNANMVTHPLRRQPWLDPNATWYEEF